MTIFAYILLLLSVTCIVSILSEKKKYNAPWRMLLYAFVVMIFIASGCVWYLFNPGLIPYGFVLGAALGSSIFFSIACTSAVIKRIMPVFHPCFLTGFASMIFFALTFILRII